jgi:hypothetical protein
MSEKALRTLQILKLKVCGGTTFYFNVCFIKFTTA